MTKTQDYGIRRWGEGYFRITAEGRVEAVPIPGSDSGVELCGLAKRAAGTGLGLPVLFRFTDILHDRVATLHRGFESAAHELNYRGTYSTIYPVKVNQQRSIVEEILTTKGARVGLEAGSKPELMAVLALSPRGGTIVCNGYKDSEYIRLALIGARLGHRVFIVIEKPSELDIVIRESNALGIEPSLGVRVRLAASAAGNWQNSGGERSKFGLSASQLLAVTDRLKAIDGLGWLQLLHTHIGSQVPNLRDIRRATGETARFYSELVRLGAAIRVIDVGGGLAVDYEGTGTRHACSMNYSVESYFHEIVKALASICEERDLPHPEVFSESGRAITAHHAVLITNVIDIDPAPGEGAHAAPAEDAPEVLKMLRREYKRAAHAPPSEVFHESRHGLEEAQELFGKGRIGLAERSLAEGLHYAVCRRLKPRLNPALERHRELLDLLHEQLADRVFCNFSLFQSLPDVWAIRQIFPVLPLQRLETVPESSAVVYDLTCDSDGMIGSYVVGHGIERSLPLHAIGPGEEYLLGIFLVGAYQEILGDMHNLFGDTNAVNVVMDNNAPEGYRLCQPEHGDSVDALLRYVHFAPEEMLESYRRKLADSGLGADDQVRMFKELESGLYGYSYLED